jgi:hypothetical protein
MSLVYSARRCRTRLPPTTRPTGSAPPSSPPVRLRSPCMGVLDHRESKTPKEMEIHQREILFMPRSEAIPVFDVLCLLLLARDRRGGRGVFQGVHPPAVIAHHLHQRQRQLRQLRVSGDSSPPHHPCTTAYISHRGCTTYYLSEAPSSLRARGFRHPTPSLCLPAT